MTMRKASSKRQIYVCSTFVERNIANLYIGELVDHYDIVDMKVERCLDDPISLLFNNKRIKMETAFDTILDVIKEADIVLAVVENYSYHYAETLTEIGMASSLGKPIIIFDSSIYEDKEEEDIPLLTYRGNIVLPSMPVYWAKTVIRTFSWIDTKHKIDKVARFISKLEKESDSD